MKIANVKGMIVKGMMVAMAAGALLVASPATASAQRFAVGVQVGGPVYGPVYGPGYGAGFYGPRERFEFERRQEILRREEFERREAFRRHEDWERGRRFDRPYGYR